MDSDASPLKYRHRSRASQSGLFVITLLIAGVALFELALLCINTNDGSCTPSRTFISDSR